MRSSEPASAEARDWAKPVTRQVAARRLEGSSGPWQSELGERLVGGLSQLRPQSTRPDADAASRVVGLSVSRVDPKRSGRGGRGT